jgi:hypothetical protein
MWFLLTFIGRSYIDSIFKFLRWSEFSMIWVKLSKTLVTKTLNDVNQPLVSIVKGDKRSPKTDKRAFAPVSVHSDHLSATIGWSRIEMLISRAVVRFLRLIRFEFQSRQSRPIRWRSARSLFELRRRQTWQTPNFDMSDRRQTFFTSRVGNKTLQRPTNYSIPASNRKGPPPFSSPSPPRNTGFERGRLFWRTHEMT